MKEIKATMDKIVNLCKNRGIIFPGSEIYGGMGNTWDYGPVGVEFKNNIKRTWWKRFVQRRGRGGSRQRKSKRPADRVENGTE